MQRLQESSEDSPVLEQKITALSRKKDLLRSEIRLLEEKIDDRTAQLEGNHDKDLKSAALKQVLGTTFPSYDHILSRLNALYCELGDDTVDDDAILQVARRHASQVVLSLATKCRASLDTAFLEASTTSDKRASYVSGTAPSVNDERDAIHAEIQSLWDEMVPLAHMVVEKDFLQPISKKVELCSERQSARDRTVSLYTLAMLHFMNERLRLLAERIKMLVYHHQTILDTFTLVNNTAETKMAGIASTASHLSPSRERNKKKDRTLIESIRRQMELYGSIPIEVDKQSQTAHTPTARAQISKLDRYVTSRQKKGDDLARNVHQFFEKVAKTELTDAELGSQLLLDSIMAESAAGSQSGGHVYDDQQVEDSVDTLKSQAEEIQTVFRELREDGTGAPLSAPEFITQAYNRAAKQFSRKDGEDCARPVDQEQCAKLAALIRNWDDTTNYAN